MKKIYLLKLSLIALMLVFAGQAFAQNISLMTPRLIVNSPGPIAGIKKFTYSYDVSAPWGRDIDSFWFNVELVKAGPDSLACTGAQSDKTGKWVLIMRGDCQFGEKAYAAQIQGAQGVIIVNNVPGAEAVGMAAGTTGGLVNIPVLMVSNPDGMAMFNALNSGQVFISLTRWGFNFDNDLAIVPYSITPAHNAAIPLSQLGAANGDPAAYKMLTGALVANVGNNDITNVQLKSIVNWTPAGGSATQQFTDSVAIVTFPVLDSIKDNMYSPRSFNPHATTLGRFDINYSITSDSVDDQGSDNLETVSLEVTPNVFSKGRYDVAKGEPIVLSGRRYGNNGCTWGPLYYVAKGGYHAEKIQFQVSDGDTSQHSLLPYSAIPVYLMKWSDANSNNYMEVSELTVKGVAARNFTALDSNFNTLNVDVEDINNPGTKVTLDDNSWYWVAVDLPNNFFVGIDDNSNYFSRTYAAQNFASPAIPGEFSAPLYINPFSAMTSAPADTVRAMTGIATVAGSNDIDSASFIGLKGSVPAIPLYIGVFPVGVNETKTKSFDVAVYPNPATSSVNVKLAFNKASDKVSVRVINIIGKTLYKQDLNNVKNETLNIPVASFANGQYYVIVTSDEGTTSQQFNVSNK